jgi:RluA family pseudouridine synthase
VSDAVKLSSPATGEFWEIPVLFEDGHLLALNKPGQLLVSPDRSDPKRPNLMQLLHRDIERGAPWARQRRLDYLMNAHRLDFGASGVILLAKNKPALIALAAQFAVEQSCRVYAALVRGSAPADTFATDAKLAPHPLQMGVIRVDAKDGKRSHTDFAVRERFDGRGCLLLECRPFPDRPHQIRVHLKHLRLPLVGDDVYGGNPLFLSTMKPGYRLKHNQEERPLIARPALHAEQVIIAHPATGAKMTLAAPWAKDLTVSIKYLRRYAGGEVDSNNHKRTQGTQR